jgi:hypothetical protein
MRTEAELIDFGSFLTQRSCMIPILVTFGGKTIAKRRLNEQAPKSHGEVVLLEEIMPKC